MLYRVGSRALYHTKGPVFSGLHHPNSQIFPNMESASVQFPAGNENSDNNSTGFLQAKKEKSLSWHALLSVSLTPSHKKRNRYLAVAF